MGWFRWMPKFLKGERKYFFIFNWRVDWHTSSNPDHTDSTNRAREYLENEGFNVDSIVEEGMNRIISKSNKLSFISWSIRAKRLMYEQEHPSFNISQVDEADDWWREAFEDGLSPQQAIDKAQEEAIDNQQ